jgi:Ca2+-transporting ATPase
VHVIFLELIMGPTCSIIYENEPIEKNIMLQKPRLFSSTFFNWRELTTSIIQGLVITLGVLFIYQYAARQGSSENLTRTMVFLALVSANIFLTLVNRSFYFSILTTSGYANRLVPLIIFITILLMVLLIVVEPIRNIFRFEIPGTIDVIIVVITGFISVTWYELIKLWKRRRLNSV